MKYKNVKLLSIPAFACIAVILILALLFSLIFKSFDLSEKSIKLMSGAAVCAGCFCGAFFAGNLRRRKGIFTGFVFGMLFFFVLFFFGNIFVKIFSLDGVLAKLFLIICSAVSGGIIGVNSKKLL